MYRCLTAHLNGDAPFSAAECAERRADVRRWAAHEIRCHGWHALRRGELAVARRSYAQAFALRPDLFCDLALLRDLGRLARLSIQTAIRTPKGEPRT